MSPTGSLLVDEGSTTHIATNTISEDAVTKDLARSVLNTSEGVEAGTAGSPLVVDLGANNDITGTVTAELSATDNAVLDTIDAVLDEIKVDTEAIETATEAIQASLETAGGQLVNLGSNNDVTVTGTVDLGATDNAVLDAIDAVLDTIKVDTEAIETAVEAIQSAQLADGHNVTIDNASGASAVNIQDGGNTITVDGTVTANLSATDNAVLDALVVDTGEIQTAVEAIQTAVEGTLTVTGGGGGTEYTEGATDATITGGVAMMEVGSDTIAPIQGTVADGILVNLGSNNDITGTVTANLSATDNAVLDNIDADLTTIIGHVDGIEGSVDGIEGLLTTIDADTGNLPTIETNTDFGTVTGGGTETGALRVTLANNSTGVVSVDDNGSSLTVDGTVTANLSATDNAVLDNIDADLTTIIGHVDGLEGLLTTIDADTGNIATAVQTLDNAISGSEMQVDVVASLPAGTNNIGDVDVASIAAGTNTIGNVGLIGRTSGGMSIFSSIDLDESEEEVKGSAGQIFSITAFNTTAAPLYLKLYNATAASVTVGTTTPVLTFVIPGNGDSDGAGFVWNNDIGFAFSTAITAAVTTGVAANDTGAPGANAAIVNIGYA